MLYNKGNHAQLKRVQPQPSRLQGENGGKIYSTWNPGILRLYIDTDVPGQLCGDMQIQPERKTLYFQNDAGLLTVLHQLAGLPAGQTGNTTGDDTRHALNHQPIP